MTALFNRLIRWSIDNPLLVVIASVALVAYGAVTVRSMPIDVFPDLTAPTVVVVTEAHGLAPEEVETLVTFPIEAAMNGSSGVRRVRSASGIGISIVWAEFDWSVPVAAARQVVNEKLQLAQPQLPKDIAPPQIAPTSSVMGEIMFLGLTWDDAHRATEPALVESQMMGARTIADHVLRKRLLSVPGVSQVIPIGGAVRQAQVLLRPESLAAYQLDFEDVAKALATTNQNASGGFVSDGSQEYLLRAVGRSRDLDGIAGTVVTVRDGRPITVRQLADVRYGPKTKRGEGSTNAAPSVVLAILKQPAANTLALTGAIDAALDEVKAGFPPGLVINKDVFRQASFISSAVGNVTAALRDGAILVAIIIFVFLANARATFISLASIPVALVVGVLALKGLGTTLNTMTIGGLTIAIGSLVDDAIIDVENVFRRLRENAHLPAEQRRSVADVIYRASVEVRTSIVYATAIIIIVFVPLFFLSGLEGRMLAPLGFAFIAAIAASLVVAVTLTPALCTWLLPKARALAQDEGRVMRALKRAYAPGLDQALARPLVVLAAALAVSLATLAVVPFLGRSFLPEFNEGALTINAITLPGTSLAESDRLGRRVEEALLAFPEVKATSRRTGRAELDEHAQDVNAAEIDVSLDLAKGKRTKDELLAEMRKALGSIGGVVATIGQPLSHRIDHMLSGTRAAIAIKIFGDDLDDLRAMAEQVKQIAEKVPGAVDVSLEQQPNIPEVEVVGDRDALARFGMTTGVLAEAVERRFAGETVGALLEGQRTVEVVVKLAVDKTTRIDEVGDTRIETPAGPSVPLRALARIRRDAGPNTIVREGVQRKMVVQANVSGRDLTAVVREIRERVSAGLQPKQGMYIVYGGQFESAVDAARTIGALSLLALVAVFALLVLAYGSVRNALLTLVNLPLALIGGVIALALTSGGLSTPALVGFITLFGIATRNGILLVTHYDHLMSEGLSVQDAVRRGSMERLAPVLMTALCAGLALIPLVLAGDKAGNEIQAPMGVVILGGLLSSTLLNMVVLPALFLRFGRKRAEPQVVETP
ncbi:MAG: multidrug transporter AcrB [Deltaproteobacteria bacterium RBG_16_71_12]|nr:MAG: multidrug transporter AcrB [Deltaproteobacteria bacterium RBG_16_71_12]